MSTVLNKTIQEKILARCIPEPNTGCWLWCTRTDGAGYGKFVFMGTEYRAHRLSFAAFKSDPSGSFVCHKCDTPACVNPDHLHLGDAKTNVQERGARKRSFVRDFWPKIMLTPELVREIRASEKSSKLLSKELGTSPKTIVRVRKFQTWKNVT